MSKELEALENIKREAGTPYFSTLYDIDDWREDFQIVETALKALEIIKKIIKYDIEANGNTEIPKYEQNDVITKEEYDLLKEVLL